MLWIRRFFLRLQTLLRRGRSKQRLDDEVQFHLEQQIAENIAVGMSVQEARYAAMRAFGNPTFLKEEARDAWGWNVLESITQDSRYALRSLRGSPLFTLTVIFSLALGIGANTAIFTLLRASLWRPLPVEDSRQIFHVMRASSEGDFAGESSYSYPLFQQFSKTAESWGEVFATEVVLPKKFGLDRISSERIAGEGVSANFFSVLDVGPVLGRVLEAQDDNVLGGSHVAVLSYNFWKRRFQSDPSVLGKTILCDETPYTVVGVARPGFFGIEPGESVDVWVPDTAAAADRGWRPDPNMNWLRLLVRLHRGVDPAQVQ